MAQRNGTNMTRVMEALLAGTALTLAARILDEPRTTTEVAAAPVEELA